MSPDRFKTVVGVLLAAVVLLALAPWSFFTGPDTGVTSTPTSAPADHVPPGYYPPAPSTAMGMTPAWRTFADSVDRICAVSFNYAIALQARTRQVAVAQGWSAPRAESAVVRLWAEEDARILHATATLGPPPERPVLFARWRGNVGRRTQLFYQASRAAAAGRFDREGRILPRISALKKRSDRIGQRFGLRICTSN